MSHNLEQAIELFGSAIGERKAREMLRVAAAAENVDLDQLGLEELMRVLERLATVPGLIGISARFAKSRAALRDWSTTTTG